MLIRTFLNLNHTLSRSIIYLFLCLLHILCENVNCMQSLYKVSTNIASPLQFVLHKASPPHSVLHIVSPLQSVLHKASPLQSVPATRRPLYNTTSTKRPGTIRPLYKTSKNANQQITGAIWGERFLEAPCMHALSQRCYIQRLQAISRLQEQIRYIIRIYTFNFIVYTKSYYETFCTQIHRVRIVLNFLGQYTSIMRASARERD